MRKTLIFILIGILALSVYGQEDKLRLNDLISLALQRNPEIKGIRSSAESMKFRIAPEGALPDPVVGFSLKNIGLDEFSVGKEMMSGVGFSISQMIPFPGKLRLKAEAASKRALQAEESLKAAELSLIRQTKELYSKLFYYQNAYELQARKKEVLEKALKFAESKYSVGKGIQSDIFKAQLEISGIEEMIIAMEQMVKTTKANMNSLLDLSPENPLGTPEEILFYELKADLNELLDGAVKKSPVLKGAELMIDESSTEVEMARREFYPDFMIQAGKDFKGPFKDMYEIMVGLEIPLFYSRKQANLLEEARLNLSSSKDYYHSMKNDISFMVSDGFIKAKTSENLIRLYRDRIIPLATLALESSLANYQVDKVDFSALLSDINSLFSYQVDYFKNLSELWSSTAKIEELTSSEFLK